MGSALLVILALATGASDSAADLKADVHRLIGQLDASELSLRTDAETKLLNLGPKILDLLPEYGDKSPATEAQRRAAVDRIRDELQRRAAEESTAASVVTLKANERPLTEILAELTRQTGNKFKDVRGQMGQEATNPKLTVDFAKTPFWQALDQTLDQAKLTVYPYGSKDELGIMAREPGAFPRVERASYAGPLRFDATQLTAQRNLAAAGAGSLKLTVQVAWEPRMRPITLQLPLADVKAVDDRGTVVAVENPEGELERPVDPTGAAVEFQIPLVDPPRTAQAIGSIRGKLQALLPGKIETFEFSGLKDAKKIEQHRAGVTVTIDEVHQNGDGWEVRMRVRFDNAANALESFRSWVYDNEAYLNGPKGKILHDGLTTTQQSKNEVGVAYEFDLPDGPDGLTFVYKTPAMLTSIPLPFEFKNLPLP
jgi:hypothetical protein